MDMLDGHCWVVRMIDGAKLRNKKAAARAAARLCPRATDWPTRARAPHGGAVINIVLSITIHLIILLRLFPPCITHALPSYPCKPNALHARGSARCDHGLAFVSRQLHLKMAPSSASRDRPSGTLLNRGNTPFLLSSSPQCSTCPLCAPASLSRHVSALL